MGRIILGVIVAIIGAIAAQSLVNFLTNFVYPAPPVNVFDQAAVAASFAMRPAGATALMAISFFVGAIAGGLAGGRVARRKWVAWVAAGLMILFALMLVMSYPHPMWAILLSLGGPAIAGFLAARATPETLPTLPAAADGI